MSTGLRKWLAAAILAAIASFIALHANPVFGEEDGGGRKIKSKVSPVYPEIAHKMNVAGVVKVQIVIAPNGTVKSTKVLGGHPLLAEAATDAIKRWKYEPASEETTTNVEVRFAAAQ